MSNKHSLLVGALAAEIDGDDFYRAHGLERHLVERGDVTEVQAIVIDALDEHLWVIVRAPLPPFEIEVRLTSPTEVASAIRIVDDVGDAVDHTDDGYAVLTDVLQEWLKVSRVVERYVRRALTSHLEQEDGGHRDE